MRQVRRDLATRESDTLSADPCAADAELSALLEQAWAAFPSPFAGPPLAQRLAARARLVGDLQAELTAELLENYPLPARRFPSWLPALTRRARQLGADRLLWLCRDAEALHAAETGRHQEAEALALLNDRLPATARPPIERCLTLLALTYACSWGGKPDEALRQGYRWLAAAEQGPSALMKAQALVTLGYIQSSRCSNHEDALPLCERALALARHEPQGSVLANTLATLLMVLLRLGRSGQALALVREAQATPGLREALQLRPSGPIDVLLACGLHDEAAQWLRAQPKGRHLITQQHLRLARVRLACGQQRFDKARRLALQALETVSSHALPPYEMAQLYDALREACDALGDEAGAAQASRHAFELWLDLVETSARARILTQQLMQDPDTPAVPSARNLRRLEAVGREAAALRQAQPQVPRLLAQVVHDLHSPSVGMLHMSRVLLASKLDAEQLHCATLMQQAASTLVRLVDDVLDLAKLEAGRFSIRAQPFALKPWLRGCFDLFEAQSAKRALALGLHLGPELPEAVVGDPLRLQQVVGNLMANAIKFTEAGAVDLCAHAEAGQDDRHCVLHLEVRDTGKGIAPQAQARLFTEFEQEDASIGPQYGGSGLGLALSRQLVQAMGGQISLHSTEGRGSVFRVSLELPVADTRA